MTQGLQSKLGLAVIGLFGGAIWLLSHGYQGIFHDGCLYALQALARIHPELQSDVFLRFGSQDRFSIFSHIFALAVRAIGFQSAAAVMTFVAQAAFLAAAWALARAFTTVTFALLGVCVVVAIPGMYGADRVFSCMETFLTPRMAAEALALAGLAAAASSRKLLAASFIVAATLVHPLMALAAIVCLYVLYVGIPRPRSAFAGVSVGVAAYAALAIFIAGTTWGRFDADWFALINTRSPYLFITNWHWDDWASVGVTLATLTLGAVAFEQPKARAFNVAVLTTVLLGFAITLIAGDWLHLVLPTQIQSWRWQWLGVAVSALLLPATFQSLCRRGIHGRISAILLLAAWIFAATTFAMAAAAASIATFFFVRKLKPNETRHVVWGSWALLAIAGAWRIGSNLEFTDMHYLDQQAPLWSLRAMSFVHDGSVPLAVIGLTWYLAGNRRRLPALIGMGAAALVSCAALVPNAWAMWTVADYSRGTIAAFAPLRQKIVPGTDIFWPEAPVAAWALLDAPSYLSVVQTSGLVFSRATAIELDRRASALKSAISPASFLDWDSTAEHMNLSQEQLAAACSTGEFGYLVTHVDLGIPSEADIPTGTPSRNLHLYHCAQPRG